LRINEVVCEMVQKFDEQLAGITLVHQIGSHSYARFKKEYESFKPKHIQFSFLEFIHDMPEK
ncbi:MAG: hypothetical protein KDD50_16195, partial [Bdellovibrionales bacterium]|nr:hypothetical protein [Bdellovibrionales bacterium]